MKITADTNLLARLIVRDDLRQWRVAQDLIDSSSLIAMSTPMLCELGWVLRSVYKFSPEQIYRAIVTVTKGDRVECNRSAVDAGLQILSAGGDFADGVIAYEGHWLGGETYASFDQRAVRLLTEQGHKAMLLSATPSA